MGHFISRAELLIWSSSAEFFFGRRLIPPSFFSSPFPTKKKFYLLYCYIHHLFIPHIFNSFLCLFVKETGYRGRRKKDREDIEHGRSRSLCHGQDGVDLCQDPRNENILAGWGQKYRKAPNRLWIHSDAATVDGSGLLQLPWVWNESEQTARSTMYVCGF